MRYFTKEYREALQNIGLVEGFDILEDKDIDINELYRRKEYEYVESEREIYDTAPIHESDLFSDLELALEDILLADLDEDGNETNFRHPENYEEWEAYKEASYKRQLEEFENREPFNEEEARELFKMNFDLEVNDKSQLPDWVYKEVDPRLIALYYLPEEVYEKLEKISEESTRRIKEIDQLEEQDLTNKRIPNHLLELLELHDSNLLKIEEKEGNIFLDVDYSSALSLEGFQRLQFTEGEILENEINRLIIDEDGLSNIYFIAREVYNMGDYFEFHFLLDSYLDDEGESSYLTIRAKNLLNISNPPGID